ncbi:hypothetical protein F4V57_14285 [Acinetobacter qingfengensis]|nr:hypothetical protein F4V57_14285 [Acinetobacter qingfengensis]
MQDEQLIEVFNAEIGGVKQQAVDARSLHSFLGSRQDFSTWARNRISKYKFVENEDFISFHKKMEREIGATKRIEYFLTGLPRP